MKNSIGTNDPNFVELRLVGDQTYDSVIDTFNHGEDAIKQKYQSPVKLLVDLTQTGHPDSGARLAGVETLKKLKYKKMALFTSNIYLKHTANFVIIASGKKHLTKVFDTRQSAINWLITKKD